MGKDSLIKSTVKSSEKAAGTPGEKNSTSDRNSAGMDPKEAAAEPLKMSEPGSGPTDTDYGPPTVPPKPDPVERTMIFAGLCIVLLIALIIAASFSNRNRYYMKSAGGAIEIRQGDFAPMGSRLTYSLPGMQPPENIKAVYTEKEILPLVSAYYIEKADALLDVPGMPDFEGIRSYLNGALSLGITGNQRDALSTRLRNLDLMTLAYKADVAARKGTVESLATALKYLEQAAALNLEDSQAGLIKEKRKSVQILKKVAEDKREKTSAPAKTK